MTKILKSKGLATDKDVVFQLVQGDFANGNKYAIQYVKKLKTKDKLLGRDSYSTKEKAENVFSSLVKINNYNQKYK
jgi:hypothetical protein